jgi:hypothetical protein
MVSHPAAPRFLAFSGKKLSACGWAAGWGTDKTANWLWAFDYFDAHTRGGNTENHKSVNFKKQMCVWF